MWLVRTAGVHQVLQEIMLYIHLQAALQVGGHGEKITQCNEVKLTTSKTIPMQVRTSYVCVCYCGRVYCVLYGTLMPYGVGWYDVGWRYHMVLLYGMMWSLYMVWDDVL